MGERLSGDRLENSLYKVDMKIPQACEIVCRKVITKFQAKTFVEAIDNEVLDQRKSYIFYSLSFFFLFQHSNTFLIFSIFSCFKQYRVHWLLDNLPSSTVVVNELAPDEPYFTRGFPVGFKAADFENGKEHHYLYNHIRIFIS